jgi:hypothetical protein
MLRRPLVFRAGRILGASVGAVLFAKALVSCIDLESLGNGPPDGPAPSEAAPAEAATGPDDPCSRTLPAPAPEIDGGDAEELPTFVLAFDEVTLDPAQVSAFDLDGVCTCDTRPGVAAEGGPSCVSDTVTCDLDGGADNAVAVVVAAASPLVAIDGISNRLIAMGHRTILLQISKYNGRANDGELVVGSIVAEGIRTQGCPTSTFDPVSEVWSKGGCGDDPWTLAPGSVLVTGSATLPLVVGKGYVRDYQLVVRFGDAARLPFNDESTIRFGAPLLSGRIVPLDETLAPRDPARTPTEKEKRLFRIERGVLAGRVLAADLLATLGTYRKAGGGGALCESPGFETVRSVICAAPDIAKTVPGNPTARCDALSAALGFVAIPAVPASVADASVTSTACDSVDASTLRCP